MATQEDVRRIALSLPDAREEDDRFAFSVRSGETHKGFAWVWLERESPRAPRVPNPGVLAVRVADATEKEALLASDSSTFFTELHYLGLRPCSYGSPRSTWTRLQELLTDGWRCQASRSLVEAFDAEHG